MKILELRFKNLNSLYGEWIIDFTHPEYVSSGIFVLAGPTGAGKSTVLDAICLALYGATPRLGKITKSENEIMSRQTATCYAEVLFESQAGRFRCHWEQRRARGKVDGTLQDQEHQIANADTGKPIETKKSLVSGVIEEKTGMDFDRFTRSILLAQGGFDTFLKAEIEQKSKLLEQLTGTEIYSRISRGVHERKKSEQTTLDNLCARISGILVLEPHQKKEKEQELACKQNRETELSNLSTKTSVAIAWLTTIANLEEELRSFADKEAELKANLEAFKPERVKLEQANKAASLDEIYATLVVLRKEQLTDKNKIKEVETSLPELKSLAAKQNENLRDVEQCTTKAKKDLKERAPIIQKVRFLDQQIKEQRKAILGDSEIHDKKREEIENNRQAQSKEQERRVESEESLDSIKQYLEDNAQDEWLIGGLTGLEEQLTNLRAKQQEISQKEAKLKNKNETLREESKNLESIRETKSLRAQRVKDAKKDCQKSKDFLRELLGETLLRELRTKKESKLREMAFIEKIQNLEADRAKLEDGNPCPLCGSIHHPFSNDSVPEPNELEQEIDSLTKQIDEAENQEALIKEQEETLNLACKDLNKSEILENNSGSAKNIIEKDSAELNVDIENLQTNLEKLSLSISKKLHPLGIMEISKLEISSLLESLKSRLKIWQEYIAKRTEIEIQTNSIDEKIRHLATRIETQNTDLAEKHRVLEERKTMLSAREKEREALYGSQYPDDEERRLSQTIADAEEQEKNIRNQNAELENKRITAEANLSSLNSRIEQREPNLKTSEATFVSELNLAGFSDEPQFLAAKLPQNERLLLSNKAQKLDNLKTELDTNQTDRKTRLASEKAKQTTDKTLEVLEPQLKENEESLRELRDDISGLKHQLRENADRENWVKEKQTAIESKQKECRRWDTLHDFIGSSDGKKYRNFAQGLTFEVLVAHANQQLEKMTDRYLLIRDNKKPLELNVVDNYQAGENRSVKNLSGGESFIVSLALALGLSKMTRRKIRVDSLFLDEGFGTLDEQALEQALDALSGLQQENKLIGIISHVSALKERIRTQINVVPSSGGRSSLLGPGCK